MFNVKGSFLSCWEIGIQFGFEKISLRVFSKKPRDGFLAGHKRY
jgi:hypothetical protein